MTGPAYYRPTVPPWVVGTIFVIVLAVVLALLGRVVVNSLQQRERDRIGAQVAQVAAARDSAQARTHRTLDSLAAVLMQRDSALTAARIATQAAVARYRFALAHPDSAPPETVLVRADAVVNACMAESHDCDAFRATATAQLATADSQHAQDTTALHTLAVQHVLRGDSLSRARNAAASMVSRGTLWKNRVEYSVTGAAVGALVCLVFCR